MEGEGVVPGKRLGLGRGDFGGGTSKEVGGGGGWVEEEGAGFGEEEVVEGAEGEDFGVPVVDGDAVGWGQFGGGEAFHACSAGWLGSRLW